MTHEPQHLPQEHEAPDEWHSHNDAEGLPQIEHGQRVNTKNVWISFVLTVVFVFGTIGLTVRYFYNHVNIARRERIETTELSKSYWEYRSATDKSLAGYGWATPENAKAGHVTIPLEQAREKVLANYGKK